MNRALIVDDKPESRRLLRALLQGHGCEVVEARHGAEALALARQNPPEIAITDLLMPVMDGYTLLRHWKADPKLKSIPLVVYTATYTDPADEKLALDLGADAFILKPTEPEAFLARLREAFARAGRGELPAHSPPTETAEPVVLREYSEVLVRKLDEKRLELEQANRELAASERRFRGMIEKSTDVVVLLDAEATIRFRSESGPRIFGHTDDAVLGHAFAEFIHPEDLPSVAERFAHLLTTPGASFFAEFRYRRPDGQWGHADATVTNWLADPDIRAVVGNVREITERKAAEAALRQSREQLSAVFENARDGILIAEAASKRFVFANPMICRMLGYDRDELLNLEVSRIHPAEDLPRVVSEFEKQARQENLLAADLPVLRKDGSVFHADINSFPITFKGQACLAGFFRDITARKEAEARVEHLSRLYATLSQINQAIVRMKSREELFPAICRAAVVQGRFALAWLGLLDRPTRTVTAVAVQGRAAKELAALRLDLGDVRFKDGLMGRALASGRLTLSRDIQHDPALAPWRALAEAHGLRAAAAVPFHCGGETFGFVVLASPDVDYFADSELQSLLTEMATDISFALDALEADAQRRRAEQAEAHARAFADGAILSLPGIFYLFSAEGRFLRWNKNFETVSGYTGEEIARLHPTDLFTGEEKELIRQRIGRAFMEGASEAEAHFTAKDGTRTPYYFTGRRLLLDGQPHLVGMGVDLSARRRAEASLRDLAHAVNAAGDVVFLTDPEGIITQINARFTSLYGYTAEEVVGQVAPRILKSGKHPPEFYQQVWATLLRGETVFGEICNRAKDGRLWDIEETITPFRDDRGELAGFMAVQREVSSRKRAEAEARLLQTIALGIGEAAGLDDALAFVLRQVCATTGWAMGEAWLPNADRSRLECHRVWHSAAPGLEAFRLASQTIQFAAGEGLPGRVWQGKQPEWIPDLKSPTRFPRFKIAGQAGLKAALGVPVLAHGEVVLVLDFFLFEASEEDPRRMELIAAVAAQIGSLIERKQAEAGLRESEAALQQAQAVAATGSWRLDIQRNRLTWSPETYRLFGLAPGTGLDYGKFLACVHPDDRAGVDRAWQAALRGAPYDFTHRIAVGETTLWVREQARLEFDADGRAVRGIGTVQDVTARKRAEEQVQLLLGLTQAISAAPDFDAALQAALRHVCEHMHWAFGEAWTPGADGHALALSPVWYGGDEMAAVRAASSTTLFPPGVGLPGRVWVSQQSEWIPDVSVNEHIFLRAEAALTCGLKSGFAVPIVAEGRVLAVLGFFTRERRAEDRHLVDIVAAVAAQLGAVLQRKQAELALRESERFALGTLDSLAAHLAILDADGKILAVNERWREFAATNPPVSAPVGEGVNYLGVCEAATGADAPTARAFAAGIRDVIAGRRTAFELEYPCHSPTEQRWFAGRVTRFAGGDPVRVVVAHENVTARKLAEDQVAASEAQFRALIENASDLVCVVDAQGVVRFLGPSSERLVGRLPEEMTGRPAFEWIHPDDASQVAAAIQRALARPEVPTTVEFRFHHKDGTWRTLEAIGRSLREAATDDVRIIVNARDVTHSRQMEEQLRQSQKMDAIGHLAGGVAHDFNNILATVLLQTELTAMEAGLSAGAREGLQQIRAAAERAANLTRQLLLFGRKQVLQSRDLDVNESVANLAKMLQRIIGEDVRLELHLHPKPLLTRADAGMLDQVLMNLAVNARDAMPQGGHLRIETVEQVVDEALANLHPDATPGHYVCLRVSDTGCGIAPEVLPHIFEPFFTTKEPGKGTGLGLATVFGIVKQHRGWMQVRSEPGRGTMFQISLPALAAADVAAAPETARPAPRGGTETILLVEDDAAVRRLAGVALDRHGYQVVEASSGAEALRVWPTVRERVALLLTDLVMPDGVSGRELAQRLRAERPGLQVIYMSGYSADLAGRELALPSGENFLQKPFPRDLLLETVRRCLDG